MHSLVNNRNVKSILRSEVLFHSQYEYIPSAGSWQCAIKTGRNKDFALRVIEADRIKDQTKCIE